MIHVKVSKMYSKGIIEHYTESGALYDAETSALTKVGENLKFDDLIKRRVDAEGGNSVEYHTCKVIDLYYIEPLGYSDLMIGNIYEVYIRTENTLKTHRLVGIDLSTKTYKFCPINRSLKDLRLSSLDINNGKTLQTSGGSLPTVYPKGTTRHGDIKNIIFESVETGSHGGYVRDEMPFYAIKKKKFTLDVGNTHVLECIG